MCYTLSTQNDNNNNYTEHNVNKPTHTYIRRCILISDWKFLFPMVNPTKISVTKASHWLTNLNIANFSSIVHLAVQCIAINLSLLIDIGNRFLKWKCSYCWMSWKSGAAYASNLQCLFVWFCIHCDWD